MKETIKKLINVIKQQVELFILNAGEFYPFGSCIDKNDNIIPIGAYIEDENDRPPSLELISLLEKSIRKGILNENFTIGAIAIDVVIKEYGESYDAVEIRFFEVGKEYKMHFKYTCKNKHVEFF